ncbi:MAG: twin-arginine translocase subunit TatC [Firmicutes bacterium]|nr:twin-arginine translocase subunit TatC [Bacillota bacterium]
MSWLQHFEDLRKVLVVSTIVLVVASGACFFVSDQILKVLSYPITSKSATGETVQKLIFIGVTEGFFIKFKVALYAGFVVSFPVIAWQIWRFIGPALYPKEKNLVLKLVPVTVLLFVIGVVFAYFMIFPVMLEFLLNVSGDLQPMITVSEYVSFCVSFLVPFGLVFEMPIIAIFLTRIGILTPGWLSSKRKYSLLICFIVAAILTPSPDPFSQTMMALPMYLLYEVSIIVSRMTRAKKDARQKAEEEAWEREMLSDGKDDKTENDSEAGSDSSQ